MKHTHSHFFIKIQIILFLTLTLANIPANAEDKTNQTFESTQKYKSETPSDGSDVPADACGYITHQTWFCDKVFCAVLDGPSSLGVSPCRTHQVILIDKSPITFTESFEINPTEGVKFYFRVHVIAKIKDTTEDTVARIVKDYGGVNWYRNNFRESIRTIIRRLTSEIKLENVMKAETRTNIDVKLDQDIGALFKETPFKLISVEVGNIEKDPELITVEIEGLKKVKAVEYERKAVDEQKTVIEAQGKLVAAEIELANKRKDLARAKAEVEAEGYKVISAVLTPGILQLEFYKILQSYKDSQNKVFFVPIGADGAPAFQQILPLDGPTQKIGPNLEIKPVR